MDAYADDDGGDDDGTDRRRNNRGDRNSHLGVCLLAFHLRN